MSRSRRIPSFAGNRGVHNRSRTKDFVLFVFGQNNLVTLAMVQRFEGSMVQWSIVNSGEGSHRTREPKGHSVLGLSFHQSIGSMVRLDKVLRASDPLELSPLVSAVLWVNAPSALWLFLHC